MMLDFDMSLATMKDRRYHELEESTTSGLFLKLHGVYVGITKYSFADLISHLKPSEFKESLSVSNFSKN